MKKIFFLTIVCSIFLTYCYSRFPLDKDLTRTQHILINQDSTEVKFPGIITGKTTLVAFIYTHCPDICPMTTHNMQLAEDSLSENVKEKVNFVVISFDPVRDSPSVLKKYAEIRDMDFERWHLLTGSANIIDEVMIKFDIKAIKTDSTKSDDGELSYNIMHTDRLSLVDKDGRLRKVYKGSNANINEIVSDINYMEEE